VIIPTTAGPVVDEAATARMAAGVLAPRPIDSNKVDAPQ